jgi:hypothetical protein
VGYFELFDNRLIQTSDPLESFKVVNLYDKVLRDSQKEGRKDTSIEMSADSTLAARMGIRMVSPAREGNSLINVVFTNSLKFAALLFAYLMCVKRHETLTSYIEKLPSLFIKKVPFSGLDGSIL